MDLPGGNGGGNGGADACRLFGKQSVNYPVKFDLKAIIVASIKPEDSIEAMEKIFIDFRVPFSNWRQKASSGGKYISYTVSVVIASQQTLEDVYKRLKTIKGLKFAL
ncbi:MAG: DUF493 domain-containing protein [Bacteroidales bacterium]|nr:DUF493 domain-containing protein [Bacteroidales bacterium]